MKKTLLHEPLAAASQGLASLHQYLDSIVPRSSALRRPPSPRSTAESEQLKEVSFIGG